jgi:hypothetical protein
MTALREGDECCWCPEPATIARKAFRLSGDAYVVPACDEHKDTRFSLMHVMKKRDRETYGDEIILRRWPQGASDGIRT